MLQRHRHAPGPTARPPRARPWLRALAAAVATGAALLAPGPAGAAVGEVGRKVFDIENRLGHEPDQVIEQLRSLQSAARAQGGDDLRVFLAAWGYAHAATNKPAVAEAAIEELTDLGERHHDDAATASAWTLRAEMMQFSGQVRTAFGWAIGAVPLAQHQGDPELRYWVDMTAADLAVSNGQLDEGMRLFSRGATDARDGRNPRREAQAWLALAPLHLIVGRTDLALEDATRAHVLAEASRTPAIVAAGWVLEALAAEQTGDLARARHARDAARLAQREVKLGPDDISKAAGGNAWLSSEMNALSQLAEFAITRREWTRARTYAERAQALAREGHDDEGLAEAELDLGIAELGLGHRAAGRRLADNAMTRITAHQDADAILELHRYAGALERAGENEASLARLREALLMETVLSRRDQASTVVALQRENSLEQHRRQVDQLQHDLDMQRAELEREGARRVFTLTLLVVLSAAVLLAGWLYRRARQANRQLAANNDELQFVSLHDKVTGLRNRRAMESDAVALGATPWCGVTISVKQFGLIIGTLGHHLGDELLRQIAARLDAVVDRRGGRLYRLDGVTFGAIFRFREPDADAAASSSSTRREDERANASIDRQLREALDALMAVMDASFEIGNQDIVVSIAAGAVRCPEHAATPAELARMAELARLRAHREPGNSYVVYEASIGETQKDKLRLESRMIKALDHGDFEVFYQAQVDVAMGCISGFEALLRWHDEGRMVSPAQFIPLAEESGLIVRIGAWVLRQACLQARAWADGGFGRPVVAVNISPRQFQHPDFVASVAATLRETGVDPAQIELEITEGSVMDDAESSIAQLHALRAMGLQLSLDDFGTGYASLAYLRRFPLDRLKIDRSFIVALNQGPQGDTIVRTMIELAHSLGLAVTAEGVETLDQEAALKGWHCDTVQGFLHARPVPVQAATERLLQARAEERERALSGA